MFFEYLQYMHLKKTFLEYIFQKTLTNQYKMIKDLNIERFSNLPNI